MRNLVKYAGIGLLVLGLAACDQKKDEAANDNGASASQSAQTVALMDGKLRFTLPPGLSDKSGKLGSQSTNMHVYADESGARAIIVIAGEPTNEALDVLAQRMEQQQRNRDPQLQVVSIKRSRWAVSRHSSWIPSSQQTTRPPGPRLFWPKSMVS